MCSSPRLFTTTFHAFHSQSSGAPESRLVRYAQRFQLLPSFAIIQKARYAVRPNRIRFTADCIFASSCSPPRFTTTQLLSATRHVAGLDMDFHHADYCASRAHWIPACAGMTMVMRGNDGGVHKTKKGARRLPFSNDAPRRVD